MIEYGRQINDDIEKILRNTQFIPRDCEISHGINEIMYKWSIKKEELYHILGNKLIYNCGYYSIDLTDENKMELADAFYTSAGRIIGGEIKGEKFLNWLDKNKEFFFDNIVGYADPDFKRMKVGDKLIKSFKYFYDGKTLRALQDLASQYIQINKIEGELCLSIHPIDFLTMSDNNANWKSCQSLDGCFRAGSISYIEDGVTMIAYIKSPEDVQLDVLPDGMKWNNKKWRMLIHLNKEKTSLWFNRQYPINNKKMVEKILTVPPIMNLDFEEKIYYGLKTVVLPNNRRVELERNYILPPDERYLIDARDICGNEMWAINFNDLTDSSTYCPMYVLKGYKPMFKSGFSEKFGIRIGSEGSCIHCGNPLDDADSFLCSECRDFYIYGIVGYCDFCGEAIYIGDEYTVDDQGLWHCMACENLDETYFDKKENE